ncbi:MAG: methionine biosynthesis protein MetW [Betaproteobacteria bacterium]|nr:methionine biosynthesis protein MetW [Betaproteobacteria bacterium]
MTIPETNNGSAAIPLSGRHDFEAIARWVKPGTRVLDLGCGDGSLLKHLTEIRGVRGYGVDIDVENIVACIGNGVNVIQGDLESGLSGFEDGSFDYVILSQTLQAMKHTEGIVREMLRVGREGIVSFPNFGFWRHRIQILLGHMPVTKNLPYQWFDTPNVHLCTIDDFEAFCAQHGVRILQRMVMSNGDAVSRLPNLLGTLAVYRIESRR